jgi:hypothetical protein
MGGVDMPASLIEAAPAYVARMHARDCESWERDLEAVDGDREAATLIRLYRAAWSRSPMGLLSAGGVPLGLIGRIAFD